VAARHLAQIWHGAGGSLPADSEALGEPGVELGLWLVRLAGFEPATRCLEGTFEPSPERARCGLTCCLAALMEADCGLV
jgi:hypothetical protein